MGAGSPGLEPQQDPRGASVSPLHNGSTDTSAVCRQALQITPGSRGTLGGTGQRTRGCRARKEDASWGGPRGVEEGPRWGAGVCGEGIPGWTHLCVVRGGQGGSVHPGRVSSGAYPPALPPGLGEGSVAPTEPPRRPTTAQVGKGIKKQYSCQQKTFAKRLNPHAVKGCAPPARCLPPCPTPPWANGQAWTCITKGSLAAHLGGQVRALGASREACPACQEACMLLGDPGGSGVLVGTGGWSTASLSAWNPGLSEHILPLLCGAHRHPYERLPLGQAVEAKAAA